MAEWTSQDIQYLRNNYSDTPAEEIAEELGRSKRAVYQKANREGLKDDPKARQAKKIQEATVEYPSGEYGNFVTGLIVGEGSFYTSNEGYRKSGWELSIKMKDEEQLLRNVHDFMGVGRIHTRTDENGKWTLYRVSDNVDIANTVIPFIDNHTIEGRKADQYAEWKSDFLDHFGIDEQV